VILPSIKNINVRGKKVLLRVDFNVPVKNGKVEDDFRIKKTLPTINLLKKKGAKIILISHTTKKGGTLRPVAKYLKIKFIPDLKLSNIKNGEVVLLENIRNFNGEESNDSKFAKQLAGLADIYINDAFSESHRKYASIVSISRYLPSYTGLLFENELKNLESVFKPKHPFLLILGGIKFKTKLGVLNKFVAIADKIFIGGALANDFFKIQGKEMGESTIDESVDVRKYLDNKKIILPIDVVFKKNKILDAGSKTIKLLSGLIKQSKFVLWNGPLGDYEKGFSKATFDVAKAIAKSNVKSIIGGGDTVSAIKKSGVSLKKFSFVSTAGGALLEFLAKGTLPGIKALERQ